MRTILAISVFLIAAAAVRAEKVPVGLIDDGHFVDGVAGLLRKEPVLDVWSFWPDEDLVGGSRRIPAGRSLQMLPCAVLEQMTSVAAGQDEQPEIRVRLWALVTQYKNFNYLYSVYFLPIGDTEQAAEGQTDAPAGEPQSDSIIPGELLAQIRAYQAPDLAKLEKVAEVTGDVNLIGRVGFMEQRDRVQVFRPDAFGQRVDGSAYRLLPGGMLSRAEREMNKTPGRQRFKVSGLVTTYKGQTYMLLRSSTRTYTHGNFTH